ncbi:peptidase C39 family protein [Rothia halotolerans]|uniref:peptidase C39 family protein n=1 Tax=Rothia halotolerans TaxID=405770 RepID=UPI001EDFB53F|nr:peptidase C39 family protein [Rothia halotolerans]
MPSHPHPLPGRTVVLPLDPAEGELERLVPGEVLRRWREPDRSAHAPRVLAVADDAGRRWLGVALTSARPGTAYVKIVDAVGEVPAVVEAVVEDARRSGLVQVKWEGWTTDAAEAAALGFAALRAPAGAGAGPDRGAETAGPASGYVRWLVDADVEETRYHRQSTDFTCGAAAAMMACAQDEAPAFGDPGSSVPAPGVFSREAELRLWREATNFPACEPVGMGLAVRNAWPARRIGVHLDADGPVLLDHCSGDEREWRAVLQRVSRAEAERTGLPIDRSRLSTEEVREALGRGERLLLLLSLSAMQGFDVPHWVLCHGAVPGALVVEDSWTRSAAGETWVDAHLLPIADASLDAMAGVEQARVRGAVRVGGR